MQSAINASLLGAILSFGLSACASLSQPAAPIVNGNPSQPPAASAVTTQPNTTTTSPTITSTPTSKPEVTAYPAASNSPITITPIKTTPSPPPTVNTAPTPPPPSRVTVSMPDLPASRDHSSTTNNEDERPDTYTVKPGDNLFRIALNYGFGYRELAEMNQINNSDEIKVGQVLRLRDPSEKEPPTPSGNKKEPSKEPTIPAYTANESKPTPKPAKPSEALPNIASQSGNNTENTSKTTANQTNGKPEKIEKPTENKVANKPTTSPESKVSQKIDTKIDNNTEKNDKNNKNAETKNADAGNTNHSWVWPTQGKLIQNFSEKTKGIDLAGKTGQPIYAAGAGKVVYSGSGLRGYGKLIIIKHDKTFLSAYAHNSQLLAKEGQSVTKGQKIAEMGNTDADQTKLHFEIRRYGKPVDPMGYLGKP